MPESLMVRLFNLHTGMTHEFYCSACRRTTEHYSVTHSGLHDNFVLKFLSRVLEDFSGLGNLLEGKPYVCKVCGHVWFE